MNNAELQKIIGNHVVELEFNRRHPKLGWSDIRGIFGTTNPTILNSDFGFQVLRFNPPKNIGNFNYKSKGLCVIWDIFRQEYRLFGAENISWHRKWPVNSPDEIEEFKKYFYDYIINLSEDKKLQFMGFISNATEVKSRWAYFKQAISKFFKKR